jgi:hypothetical protein
VTTTERNEVKRISKNIKRTAAAVVAVSALAVGGSAIATAATKSASTTAPPKSMPAPGTKAHEDAEKPVTGSAATQAQAAAVKSVGSGTAGAVTTDYFGTGYEVTVTKSDGSTVEVHLDSSFAVQSRPGGPRGPGGPGGHGGPGAPAPTTTTG